MAEFCEVARKQDLPPPGGYQPIKYKRNPARSLFSGVYILNSTIFIYFCICYVTWYLGYVDMYFVLISGLFFFVPCLFAFRCMLLKRFFNVLTYFSRLYFVCWGHCDDDRGYLFILYKLQENFEA